MPRSVSIGIAVVAALMAGGCAGGETAGRSSSTTAADPVDAGASSSTSSTTAATTTTPATTVAPSTTSTVPLPAPAGHDFPVRPAAAVSYDPSHHDYPAADIFAPCGSEVVAVTDGVIDEVVLVDQWSSANDSGATRSGLLVSLVGDDGVRYYGSHMSEVAPGIDAGVRVTGGSRIGSVGDTGNARGSGCHLHFGLSAPCGPGDWERRRGEVWPQPYLDQWRTGADAAPAIEISTRRC